MQTDGAELWSGSGETEMARGDAAAPRVIGRDGATSLRCIELDANRVETGWLQTLIHTYPSVVPTEAVSFVGKAVATLGREIDTGTGFLGNLFVSADGELVLLETALWSDPAVAVAVVGRLADHANALRGISYDDLEALVIEADGDDRSIWRRVCDGGLAACAGSSVGDEDRFVSELSGQLAAGTFLMVVAGGGAPPDAAALAAQLADGGTEARLQFVEMAPYYWSAGAPDHPTGSPDGATIVEDEAIVVVPRLIGDLIRPEEVVIDLDALAGDRENKPTPSRRDRTPMASIEEFLSRLTDSIGSAEAGRINDLIAWWTDEQDGRFRLNKASANLSVQSSKNKNGAVSVLTIHVDGTGTGSVEPLSDWFGVVTKKVASQLFADAGFRGNELWPSRTLDLIDETNWELVTTALASIASIAKTHETRASLESGDTPLDAL